MSARRMRFEMAPPEGAEAIGLLHEAPPALRFFVWSLRSWLEGPENQQAVWRRFSGALGPGDGRCALKSFETALRLICVHQRRRLHRHRRDCACLGADEAVIGGVLAASAELRVLVAAELAERLVLEGCAERVVEAGMGLAPHVGALLSSEASDVCVPARGRTLH